MNVLVFFLSKINPDKNGELPSIKKYIFRDDPSFKEINFEGMQTNEAAAKYLIAKLDKSGGKLGKIIAVTSREAEKNGKQRFIDGIKEPCGRSFDVSDIKFVRNYSGEKPLADEAVLAGILKEISPDDTVYLDVSGGKRTDVNMMLLLMKLVKYKGIKVADAFYSDYDGTISSHYNRFYRNLDILDGVNQFVTTGNAVQLAECYSSISEDSSVKALLAAMVDFSDSVNLCSLSGIEDTLSKMKFFIDEISGSDGGGMDMFLFREIIPIIREKFFGNSGNPDYCQIILWCLDNRLIQQAITLYVEKIPKHLFDKGLLSYTEQLKQETIDKNKKTGELNLEREIFFSKLMSSGKTQPHTSEDDALLVELKNVLGDPNYITSIQEVVEAKKSISAFYRFGMKNNIYYCSEAAAILLKSDCKDPKMRIIAQTLSNPKYNYSFKRMRTAFSHNDVLLKAILGLTVEKSESEDATLENKIATIENVFEIKIPNGIEVNISRQNLRVIMLDYLYARQIRNRINHAADASDNLQKQEEFFSKYRIDYSFSMRSIISQLKKSVEFTLNLSKKT